MERSAVSVLKVFPNQISSTLVQAQKKLKINEKKTFIIYNYIRTTWMLEIIQ